MEIKEKNGIVIMNDDFDLMPDIDSIKLQSPETYSTIEKVKEQLANLTEGWNKKDFKKRKSSENEIYVEVASDRELYYKFKAIGMTDIDNRTGVIFNYTGLFTKKL